MMRLPRLFFSLAVALGAPFASTAASATIAVSGGITVAGNTQPLLFTWNATLPVAGSGWSGGESITIVLHGPVNSLGVDPADLVLGSAAADDQGNFSASPVIPYDSGIAGAAACIPRPGLYEVHAAGATSGDTAAADLINLCPDTYTGAGLSYDWGRERGGREGVLPGPFRQFSPERFDPEWATVWDERPVAVYGTVAPAGGDPTQQGSAISGTDNPATHYAHDSNLTLIPDSSYQWLIGTSNYYSEESDAGEAGRLKVEWETLNGGTTAQYDQGNIGLPLWAKPTTGDRVYVVGRWILDAGHPEIGDRTEIHPPRLLATMRQRAGVTSTGMAAAQVDVYVSGHGGGANRMPAGLSEVLNQGGWGGGRIRDVLGSSDQDRYYRAGPLSSLLSLVVIPLIEQIAGASLSGQIYPTAGPTAFPWGAPSPEQRPISDMDYDFDVLLPSPPDGATSIMVESNVQPEHSTTTTEVITFVNPVNNLPTVAHVHLPYAGADDGVYAKTLKFYWDTSVPPASHLQLSINRVDVIDAPGKWQLWADIGGQWKYVTGLAPALLETKAGSSVAIPFNQFDVWLGAADGLQVFVQGYRATCLDDYFGKLFGMTSYEAGLSFLANCGPIDNQDLGVATLQLPAPVAPGDYTIVAHDSATNTHFAVSLTLSAVR